MKRILSVLPERSFEDIETAMRSISLISSGIAVVLMVGGMIELWAFGNSADLSHVAVVPLRSLMRLQGGSAGVLALSAGVVLLALVPTFRVMLALGIYLRRNQIRNIAITIVVILELLISFYHGS